MYSVHRPSVFDTCDCVFVFDSTDHLTVTLTAVVQLAHVTFQCHQSTARPQLMTVYVVDDTDYYIYFYHQRQADVDSNFDMGGDSG